MRVQTIILAGGRGKRLRPHTDAIPKPLLPVGKHPILYHLLRGLERSGIREMTLAVGYRADVIEGYFGDGSAFGLQVRYAHETKPMGTAGPLRAAWDGRSTVLALNGDLLTDFDYRRIFEVHAREAAALTAGIVDHRVHVRFGTVEREGARLRAVREKPDIPVEILAGIYVISPEAMDRIPTDAPSDVPQLIAALLDGGHPVAACPLEALWIDVGIEEELVRARELAREWD
ncbi:MAG: NTP transferase domain-containing protein [Myxococcales bacterium]|nr:NTP transferase domain-containing protein [Myxococcales bacterium]